MYFYFLKKCKKIYEKLLTYSYMHGILYGQLIDGPVAQLVRAHP